MPNNGLPRIEHLPNDRHGIFAGRRRVAGTVRQEETVGLMAHHFVEAGGGRQDRHLRPGLDQVAEDVALGAIVDGDDMRPLRPIAAAELL